MRKVIAVDGTHLKGKYRGVLLTAVAQDVENHVFPVTCCVVDSECDASWNYFFQQLVDIVPNSLDLCIISDRHLSIKKAIRDVYTNAYHCVCTRHLCERMRGRAFFPGNRFKVLTPNIVESFNSMFLVEKEFPITAFFNDINMRFATKFNERRTLAKNLLLLNKRVMPRAESRIRKRMEASKKVVVIGVNENKYTACEHDNHATVNLSTMSCSCRVFDVDKLPCPHAIAALSKRYPDTFKRYPDTFGASVYNHSSTYYSADAYHKAYEGDIVQISHEMYL
ncbi:uncharacterized protein LOC132057736 [Lycium ferocissimum]|uniref:uncharacterized protein LOC132057736 n=1 Tax=Lycium ferocissimum TaxID=112874 RepID=UPI002815D05F|nr:uncharacterized protein LOC132057736 [Lycium ferocissimum]